MGTAEIIRLNVEAVATSPSRSTRLGARRTGGELQVRFLPQLYVDYAI